MKKTPHSGTLTAPAPEPGVLHVDLKEMVRSKEGYRWVVFAIDEHTRYVFIEFIKSKSEAADAVLRIIAAFDAIVATPVDADGKALPRPRVWRARASTATRLAGTSSLAPAASLSSRASRSQFTGRPPPPAPPLRLDRRRDGLRAA